MADLLTYPAVQDFVISLVPPREPEMQAMEEYGKKTNFPIIGPAAGYTCYQIARLIGAQSIFELGSGYGYSTAWFAKAVKENGGGVVHHVVWDQKLSDLAAGHLSHRWSKGWQIDGVREDGTTDGSIQLTRRLTAGASASGEGDGSYAPWLEVTHVLDFGVAWSCETTVRRVTHAGMPIVAAEPDSITLEFHGWVSGITSGSVDNPTPLMPTWLEWLKERRKALRRRPPPSLERLRTYFRTSAALQAKSLDKQAS